MDNVLDRCELKINIYNSEDVSDEVIKNIIDGCEKDDVMASNDLENIAKHSKIISEIVEVGDYVNGKLIHKIDKGTNFCYLYYGNCKTFVNYQIKSIVTHEQFASIEYKVEEGN